MSNIFEDKSKMPTEAPEQSSYAIGPSQDYPRGDAPVRTCMTPAEARALAMSNYPRYDAMDVEHVARSRRGHDI